MPTCIYTYSQCLLYTLDTPRVSNHTRKTQNLNKYSCLNILFFYQQITTYISARLRVSIHDNVRVSVVKLPILVLGPVSHLIRKLTVLFTARKIKVTYTCYDDMHISARGMSRIGMQVIPAIAYSLCRGGRVHTYSHATFSN